MQCYGERGIFDAIFGQLYPGHPVPRPRNYQEARVCVEEFSTRIGLPTIVGNSREDQKEIYGRLLRVHEILISQASPAKSTFHGQNFGLLRTMATMGGRRGYTGSWRRTLGTGRYPGGLRRREGSWWAP